MTEPDAGHTGPSPSSPHGAVPGAGPVTWASWEADLAKAVMALADGETLTATGAPELERPVLVRRGFLRGFVPAKHAVLPPWVRLTRVEDHLRGVCVGDERFGGPFPLSPEEDEALVALGWRRPGAGDGTDYLRFWPDDVPQGPFLPREEAERVAALVARTFREVLTPAEQVHVGPAGPALPVVTHDGSPQPPAGESVHGG